MLNGAKTGTLWIQSVGGTNTSTLPGGMLTLPSDITSTQSILYAPTQSVGDAVAICTVAELNTGLNPNVTAVAPCGDQPTALGIPFPGSNNKTVAWFYAVTDANGNYMYLFGGILSAKAQPAQMSLYVSTDPGAPVVTTTPPTLLWRNTCANVPVNGVPSPPVPAIPAQWGLYAGQLFNQVTSGQVPGGGGGNNGNGNNNNNNYYNGGSAAGLGVASSKWTPTNIGIAVGVGVVVVLLIGLGVGLGTRKKRNDFLDA